MNTNDSERRKKSQGESGMELSARTVCDWLAGGSNVNGGIRKHLNKTCRNRMSILPTFCTEFHIRSE